MSDYQQSCIFIVGDTVKVTFRAIDEMAEKYQKSDTQSKTTSNTDTVNIKGKLTVKAPAGSAISAPEVLGGYMLNERQTVPVPDGCTPATGYHRPANAEIRGKIIFHHINDYNYEDDQWHGGSDSNDEDTKAELNPMAVPNKNGEAKVNVTASEINSIVKNAKELEAGEIVIAPNISGEAGKVTVNVPATSARSLAQDAKADLCVKTDLAEVVMGVDDLSKVGTKGNLTISAEKGKNGACVFAGKGENECSETAKSRSGRSGSFGGQQVGSIGDAAGEDAVVKALLPVDVVQSFLQLVLFFQQPQPLLVQKFFATGDGELSLQTQGDVILHFRQGQVTVFQAGKAPDPGNVPFVKDPAVLFIPLNVGDKALVAIKLQRFVTQLSFLAGLLHGVHKNSPKKVLTGSYYRVIG